MESTAINTVYCIMHCVGETEWELKMEVETEKGYLWEVYTREDSANEECRFLNELETENSKNSTMKDKFIVVEKRLF